MTSARGFEARLLVGAIAALLMASAVVAMPLLGIVRNQNGTKDFLSVMESSNGAVKHLADWTHFGWPTPRSSLSVRLPLPPVFNILMCSLNYTLPSEII